MNKYITPEAAKHTIRHAPVALTRDEIKLVERLLDAIKPAEVRPVVEGVWIEKIVNSDDPRDLWCARRWYCTACGDWQTYGQPRYCPSCGAKMRNGDTGRADNG